ncbi:MAG: TerD family protein [Tepidibacter sp.]|jgi:stress response protein SCP2|uniref:TerD family protein n=1 Tax=Tepidibacter sp. TaxID=2529387 RepID=UPI0025EB5D78|nr:TerD family protein [Tepidibacter sp.]MCT4508820.1 TerD family protein [Tepidibacter sp.]
MAINLQKGQKIDLTKGNAGISKVMVGLGWDPVERNQGGLLSGLFGGGRQHSIDCDASVLMLNSNEKIGEKKDIIYFGNLKSECRSVVHTGDNLTGDGDGDDEQIIVDLNNVPSNIHKLVFIVNIYDCVKRKQDFGLIKNAFIRVVNSSNRQELIRYNLTDDYVGRTTLVVGEMYRHNGEWKFAAVGEGTNDPSIREFVKRYK